MLRILGTINSKNYSEVKIIQKFDKDNVPKINSSLLRQYKLYLADLDLKEKINSIESEKKRKEHYSKINNKYDHNPIPKSYQWIGKIITNTS